MHFDTGRTGPRRPALSLRLGVTGHRHLPSEAIGSLAAQVETVLGALASAIGGIGGSLDNPFAGGEPNLTILSQLAVGADQLVAQVGMASGWSLAAVMPFSPDRFFRDFDEPDRERFVALLDQCEASWHLPGDGEEAQQAYALAGEATVAQSDLLIAIWDGATARGPGGTADVVDHAIRRGVPVVHISATGAHDATLLWAGIDSMPSALLHRHNVPRRPADQATLTATVEALLLSPAEAAERRYLAEFAAERLPRVCLRLEYPVMLAVAGVRPLRRTDLLPARSMDAGDALDEAYCWADRLADAYAQVYRSGSVFNFAAAAAAVLVALLGFLAPHLKLAIVAVELLLIVGLIANTMIGNRREWHRRWLDYRYLAEQLRVMRSLKRLNVATPMTDVAAHLREARWTDFYAAAIWRQLTPATIADQPALAALAAEAIADIKDQISYHRANSARMHLLDHRLHQAGTLLFHATIAVGLISLVGLAAGIDLIVSHVKLFTFLSAALPTVGGALFGIRGQGDFAGAAGRSSRTAARLERSAASLCTAPFTLGRTARIMEDAAISMLDDLGEWRAAYTYRKLLIPA